MQILFLDHPLDEWPSLEIEACVMALGFFDGIHLGHQQIIHRAREIAQDKKLKLALMTFTPHPSEVIRPSHGTFPYITPLYDKIKLLAHHGVEILYVVRFDTAFSRLTPHDFVEQYLIGLRCKHVVAGFDFTYGYQGAGRMIHLANHDQDKFEVTIVEKVERHNQKISSTLIRQLIKLGHVDQVPEYLGRHYEINGQVIASDRGSCTDSLIRVMVEGMLPKPGIYTITAQMNRQTYHGICQEICVFDHYSMLILRLADCPACDDSASIKVRWLHFEQEIPLPAAIQSEWSSFGYLYSKWFNYLESWNNNLLLYMKTYMIIN